MTRKAVQNWIYEIYVRMDFPGQMSQKDIFKCNVQNLTNKWLDSSKAAMRNANINLAGVEILALVWWSWHFRIRMRQAKYWGGEAVIQTHEQHLECFPHEWQIIKLDSLGILFAFIFQKHSHSKLK